MIRVLLLLLVGCGEEPLSASDIDMAASCRAQRYAWIQNDGGPACCGGEWGRCCAGVDPCDPGLRCELNYTSTCWRVDFGDGGAP